MRKKIKKNIPTLVVILIIIIILGIIGAIHVDSIKGICDFGVGKSLCWKWHIPILE